LEAEREMREKIILTIW